MPAAALSRERGRSGEAEGREVEEVRDGTGGACAGMDAARDGIRAANGATWLCCEERSAGRTLAAAPASARADGRCEVVVDESVWGRGGAGTAVGETDLDMGWSWR